MSSTDEKPALRHRLLSVVIYAFFALFLLLPIAFILSGGFFSSTHEFTTAYLKLVFTDPVLLRGLLNSAMIAVSVTLLTVAVSLPMAIITVRYSFTGRNLLSGLLLAPLILPPFVGAIGVRFLLGRLGPLSALLGMAGGAGFDWLGHARFVGVVLLEALSLYPVMLLNLQAALANIDPAMEQAAANLGASRGTIFRRITLPLIRPGLFAGATIVLIWSFTELGTPLMFDIQKVTPVQVFYGLTEVATSPMPYALVVVVLLASTVLYLIGKLVLGRPIDAATTKASTAWSPRKVTGRKAFFPALPVIIVAILAILPHIMVVLTSLTATGAWYRSVLPQHLTTNHFVQALTDELAVPSVFNSVKYATLATAVAVLMGLSCAIIIVRSTLRTRGVLDALSMLPLAVPGLVMAFGYLALSVELKVYWKAMPVWLDVQEQPMIWLVIAYAMRRLPYVVRSAVAGLQQTPRDLELAAANLGAGRARVLARITVPLIAANLIAGAMLAFSFALLEVSDSLVLAQKAAAYPITRAIYDLAQKLGDGLYIASALGVWAMVLLALTVLATNSLLGRKLGAIFRI